MSNAVPAQHPAVVLRSNYQHLRALLAIATIVIVGLTVAVVVLAINSGGSTTTSPVTHATPSAVRANPSAEIEAKLDHRGLKPTAPQLGNKSSYSYSGHY